MGDPVKLSAAVLELLSPLIRDDLPPIEERCPDCHLPLHDGKELHYATQNCRNGTRTVKRHYAKHRCTGLDLPAQLGGWMR